MHAQVETKRDGLLIRDLGSRHGTSIQGEQIGREPVLAEFDRVVRFGDTLLLVSRDVDSQAVAPRWLPGAALGFSRDVLAGPLLARVWDHATRVAALPYPVLVQGESGSGKEAIARLIHRAMGAERPFVPINVAAIPEALFDAELFGYERGAFTGAVSARAGAFRQAAGGVLFLDEVAELRLELQAKLLRAIEQHSVRPLGASREIAVAVKVVAATHHDLSHACDAGTFRSDLHYRLRGVVVQVPPLRERVGDVLLLALKMLEDDAPSLGLSASAAERLVLGAWEGNVRELRYAVVHAATSAVAAGCQQVWLEHLPEFLKGKSTNRTLSEAEIRLAMGRSAGVASRAAELLGVSRTTFYNTCKRLGIHATSLRVN